MGAVVQLDLHRIRAFRMEVRRLWFDYCTRAERRSRWVRWAPPLLLAAGCILAMFRAGYKLGVPSRSMRRLIDNELSAIEREERIY